MHNEKICHRDLKLENLLINEEHNKIYLTDFGTAKFFEPGIKLKEREGTLNYLPPEMLDNMSSTES